MSEKDCRSRPVLSTPFRRIPSSPHRDHSLYRGPVDAGGDGRPQAGNGLFRSFGRSTDSVRSACGKIPARHYLFESFSFGFKSLCPTRTVINPSSGYVGPARRCHYSRVADQSGGIPRPAAPTGQGPARCPQDGLAQDPGRWPGGTKPNKDGDLHDPHMTTPLRPRTLGSGRNIPERHAAHDRL